MTIRSEQFDDIYFSPEDGVAETRHVFLAGNGLPEAWEGRNYFTIAETGFGTGLNFLCAWQLFEETATEGQSLDFISFEKYPLSKEEIRGALSRWIDVFEDKLDIMLERYPLRVPGFHRIVLNERVRLTLVFDDVNDALPELVVPRGVDCWFLDGFAPSKNPDMWSDTLFSQMARLSAPQARVATFTVAGVVKRGLQEAGFAIEKKAGFGRKREMLCGRFEKSTSESPQGREKKKVAIIGGGLAGTACAYVLKQQGLTPVIYEASGRLASGASGNPLGLYNPRFSAHRTAESDFYTVSYAQAVNTLSHLSGIELRQCGAVHLLSDEARAKKLGSFCRNGGWSKDHMVHLNASQAADMSGFPVSHEALYLTEAGCVSPEQLCRVYAEGVEVVYNHSVAAWDEVEADAVVLACAMAVADFQEAAWIPLETVRGQVSFVKPSSATATIKTTICYGGYISPVVEGTQFVGTTFQKWLDHCEVQDEDHQHNIGGAEQALSLLKEDLPVACGGRAALRTTSKDRFPVVGNLPDKAIWDKGAEGDQDDVYVSTAHGSHGIISSLAAAHIIADKIQGRPYGLPRSSVDLLSPARFLKRARKKKR